MGKKKIKKQSAKETLAEVIKEMAKPRVLRPQESRVPFFLETKF
jgi:hypothetical protein